MSRKDAEVLGMYLVTARDVFDLMGCSVLLLMADEGDKSPVAALTNRAKRHAGVDMKTLEAVRVSPHFFIFHVTAQKPPLTLCNT